VTDGFRAEARDWLAAHVPAGPLPSLDTAEGFEEHRAWEHPAHRYLKRAHGARLLFGRPDRHAAAIAASLLGQQ
jgi:hypothetical protein